MNPIEIVVGGPGPYDPVDGATACNIPTLLGQDLYVSKAGYGPYPYANYRRLTSGGFRLLNGLTFHTGEQFYVFASGLTYGTADTAYTNGFNYNAVMAALYGRIGWRQTAKPGAILTSENLLSKSGRYFNDMSFHALVTLNNIYQAVEDVAMAEVDFNALLSMMQKSVILRALTGVFNPPEYIMQGLLYERWLYGANDEPLANTGKFVGVKIKVPPAADLATQIDTVALYFDSDVNFNLYLFNDTQKAAVWFDQVSAVAYTQTVIGLPDIILNHLSNNNLGGIFYLGYFQDDLGAAKAIKENNVTFKCHMPYSAQYFETAKNGAVDFDRKNVGYQNYNTYGLNLHMSVFRDHTQQIVKKASLFDNLIGLQMAAQVIENMMYADRSNATERVMKDAIQLNASLDLNGVAPISDGPHTTGLKKQISQELMRVKKGFFPEPKAQTVNLC